jgi:Ni/Fe-hydrogenase subunit HybB-like protein
MAGKTYAPIVGLDNTGDDPVARQPLILGDKTYGQITEQVCAVVEDPKIRRAWLISFLFAVAWLGILFSMIVYLISTGVGVWGNQIPVAWGWPIVNFVFWVGIGHAGTLISAILFLMRQDWRTSINRFAEAMTIFAVICAGLFPGIHVGRIWLAYWLLPLPNQMLMWPQFRSPLLWDVFAVGTYASVSLVFWYMGMVPDLATLRDRARHPLRRIAYGLLALGWRGSNRAWHRYERAYLLLSALCTPLVLSVHTVVSFDFAVSQLPGWHTTIFPPYFVAGAIFSGFAMVVTLAVPARAFYGMKNIITMRHLENMNKVILATGMMVGYAYSMEFFMAWYSGNQFEQFAFINRAFGPYWWAYWTMVSCNVLVPQVFWFKKARTSIPIMMVAALLVNVGMWFERFVITISSLSRDFLPSSWGYFRPTMVDILMLIGSFGLFFTLFLLFLRFLPMIAMAEAKSVMPLPKVGGGKGGGGKGGDGGGHGTHGGHGQHGHGAHGHAPVPSAN